MPEKQLVYMYVIADRKLKGCLLNLITARGGALIDFSFGWGYHEIKGMLDFLGLSDEKGKIVISFLITKEKSIDLITSLNDEYNFKAPGTGIAFTIPVEKLVY